MARSGPGECHRRSKPRSSKISLPRTVEESHELDPHARRLNNVMDYIRRSKLRNNSIVIVVHMSKFLQDANLNKEE
jgi:hypothetical protein